MMKHIQTPLLSIFFFLFTLSPSLQAQENFYTLYIGTFVNAKSESFDNIREYGIVYSEQFDESLQKIYLGGFTSREKAEAVLGLLRPKGYSDAFVSRKVIDTKKQVAVIQLGLSPARGDILWSRYAKAGPLYAQIQNDQMKIVTGLYRNTDEAKRDLDAIRNGGFSDAFIKTISRDQLVRLGPFEMNGIRPERNLKAETAPEDEDRRPSDYESWGDRLPASYEDDSQRYTFRGGDFSTGIAKPEIRGKMKRNSALELQKVLKGEKTYSSSLDGYYGPGTRKGYETYTQKSRDWQKYQLLAEQFPPALPEDKENRLEYHILNLIDEPEASRRYLESSDEPIARAYLAYLLFTGNESPRQVDRLMNSAIQDAFRNTDGRNRPSFDYRSTYAYNDLGQLIQHLRYIQGATQPEPAAPCWLFELHPKEAKEAYESESSFSSEDYNIQNCDRFLEWNELNTLHTIAAELAVEQPSSRELRSTQNRRSRMYLSPQPLSGREAAFIGRWNDRLWKALDARADREPLYQKVLTPFKVAFFQSQVLLEDHFMDKGFKQKEAQKMALLTLSTIVDPYLKAYY
jgi:hypothetical protein